MIVNGYIEVNGKRLPITAQLEQAIAPDTFVASSTWQAAMKHLREPIHCKGYLTNSNGEYQPVGKVVESNIEPCKGECSPAILTLDESGTPQNTRSLVIDGQ